MLSPEPMRHLSLVVLEGDLEVNTRAIARVGVLHLLNVCHWTEMLGAIRHYDVSERLGQLEASARTLDGARQFFGIEAPEAADPGMMSERPAGPDLQTAQALGKFL